jgi:hypothetical protein
MGDVLRAIDAGSNGGGAAIGTGALDARNRSVSGWCGELRAGGGNGARDAGKGGATLHVGGGDILCADSSRDAVGAGGGTSGSGVPIAIDGGGTIDVIYGSGAMVTGSGSNISGTFGADGSLEKAATWWVQAVAS